MSTHTRLLTFFAMALASGACGGHATMPTAPSASVHIDAVAPAAPAVSPVAQTLTVTGAGFVAPIGMIVTEPTGASHETPVQLVASTELTTTVTFAVPGTYLLTAQDKDGVSSAPYSISVASSEPTTPTLFSVAPATANRSAAPQLLTLTGSNLSAVQSVQVTAPDGQTTTFSAGQFTVGSDTLVSLSAVLSKAGLYLVLVSTGSEISNNVSVTVN